MELTTIEGYVTEYGTNDPIANAELVLYLNTSESGLTSPVSTFRSDTIYTNEEGYYLHEFDHEGASIIDLSVSHEDYFKKETDQIFDNIFGNRENNVDVVMDPKSWLRLHIKNVNPFNESDNIRYNGNWGGAGPQDNPGTNVDFFDTKEIRGNDDIRLTWTVTKDGIQETYRDTIYCPGHEITEYEIHY